MHSAAPREYALYLRKSKGLIGIPRQRTVTTAYINGTGDIIGPEFADADRTAFRKGDERPEREDFDNLLAWLGGRRDAGAAAWHADRFVRDPEDAELLIRVCRRNGHLVATKAGGVYDMATANGRKHFRQDALDATSEVDHNTERILEQKLEAAAGGLWLGGWRPFGYEGIPAEPGSETKFLGLRVVPAEAAAISSAARAVLAGDSLNSVVTAWNAKGITGIRGGRWTISNLRRLLLNPRYAGIAGHHGAEVGPAKWPPVVREEVFRALQVKLSASANPGHPTARRWLGSGLYQCGVCHKPVHVQGGLNERHRERSYACPGHVARQVGKTDKHVTNMVLAYLERPESAEALAAARPLPQGEDIALLQAQKILITERQRKLGDHYHKGVIDDATLAAGAASAREDLAALDRRIVEASRVSPLAGVAGNPRIREEWPGMSLLRKQAIIRDLIIVRIHPSRPGAGIALARKGESWFDTKLIKILPGPALANGTRIQE